MIRFASIFTGELPIFLAVIFDHTGSERTGNGSPCSIPVIRKTESVVPGPFHAAFPGLNQGQERPFSSMPASCLHAITINMIKEILHCLVSFPDILLNGIALATGRTGQVGLMTTPLNDDRLAAFPTGERGLGLSGA